MEGLFQHLPSSAGESGSANGRRGLVSPVANGG